MSSIWKNLVVWVHKRYPFFIIKKGKFKVTKSDKIHILPWKMIFYKIFSNLVFIDDCYELRSYERGVAQLGSTGALGAYLFTNETYCNNWLSYFYNKLYSDGKWQTFISAGAFKLILKKSFKTAKIKILSNWSIKIGILC